MSNEDVYAGGLLTRALDPATQPDEIRAFFQTEIEHLRGFIDNRMSVLDVGCGTGRHLALLRDRVRIGVGVDYERAYLIDAAHRTGTGTIHFVAADAARLPLRMPFDAGICMTNTWGTMSDKVAVVQEMRRCVPDPGRRLVSVFSERSVRARREWYRRFGHAVVEETSEWLMTDGGLRSEHFTQDRLRSLIGDCSIQPCADVGYLVTF